MRFQNETKKTSAHSINEVVFNTTLIREVNQTIYGRGRSVVACIDNTTDSLKTRELVLKIQVGVTNRPTVNISATFIPQSWIGVTKSVRSLPKVYAIMIIK